MLSTQPWQGCIKNICAAGVQYYNITRKRPAGGECEGGNPQ